MNEPHDYEGLAVNAQGAVSSPIPLVGISGEYMQGMTGYYSEPTYRGGGLGLSVGTSGTIPGTGSFAYTNATLVSSVNVGKEGIRAIAMQEMSTAVAMGNPISIAFAGVDYLSAWLK